MDIILFFSMKFSYDLPVEKLLFEALGAECLSRMTFCGGTTLDSINSNGPPTSRRPWENSLFRRDRSSSSVTAAVNTTSRYLIIYYLALNFHIVLISSADVESRRLNQTTSFDATKSIGAIYIRRDRKDVGNK